MKRIPLFTMITAIALAALVAIPSGAQAGQIQKLAELECKLDRAEDPREFRIQFNGSGKSALKHCIAFEKRSAKRDCRRDQRFEPGEFAQEYGTGRDALKRCYIDELR